MADFRKSRTVGGSIAGRGAGLMTAMVWAPADKTPGESMSGWDIHEQASGSQQWFIGDFVDPDFSPFFPALPILVAAGVMGFVGLGQAMKRQPPGQGALIVGL